MHLDLLSSRKSQVSKSKDDKRTIREINTYLVYIFIFYPVAMCACVCIVCVCVCVCVCVYLSCVFTKLHITAQSSPVILLILLINIISHFMPHTRIDPPKGY